jgi:divalent metal cation (Fe/Co/Zn/Cd) transporter
VFTGSPAVASEASHSLPDTANDLFLMTAQRRSSRPPDNQHPWGHGREPRPHGAVEGHVRSQFAGGAP